ncbi:hypothetical protein PENTCL1PPCAC_14524, partial [Pristionchus entomophagus]
NSNPDNESIIAAMMGGKYGDRMTFLERVYNVLTQLTWSHAVVEYGADYLQEVVGPKLGGAHDIMAASSLVFLNSDPLADFPKLTSARVIDIGGISVHDGHKPLDEYWSKVLGRRSKTVFLSFGTWIKGILMPQEYKETIRETIRKFPDVTFIWKYEDPEEEISKGLANVVETTWAPQTDILHDARLTAFITHGGQGSITESATAGVPLVCIPVTADQFRNGRQVERNGVGVMVEKESLATVGPLEQALRRVIDNDSYRQNAQKLAQMIADRPFSMKDIFVRNMEFLAKYGPLDRLHHHAVNLSFIEYYLIDVFTFFAFAVVSFAAISVFIVWKILRITSRLITVRKLKTQ